MYIPNGGRYSNSLKFLEPSYASSSPEASDNPNSALISAFDFSWGIAQSAKALSLLSLHVLQKNITHDKMLVIYTMNIMNKVFAYVPLYAKT